MKNIIVSSIYSATKQQQQKS